MSIVTQLLTDLRERTDTAQISDLHLKSNEKPWVRVNGKLKIIDDAPEIQHDEIEEFYTGNALTNLRQRELDERGYTTLSMSGAEFGDVRVHVQRHGNDGIKMVIRLLGKETPTLESYQLPAVVRQFVDGPSGLYLFTGATGSGKTTLANALIHAINEREEAAIYTFEDPTEYRHLSKRSNIEQFNVPDEIPSYEEAIRSVLRMDPDVIFIGEMRDTTTMRAAIIAAQTGHKVISTLHDNGAAQTCQRILGSFSGEEAAQMRSAFVSTMQAVVSMRLLPLRDGSGRVGAYEIMRTNTAIRSMLREGNWAQLPSAMTSGSDLKMHTLEQDLVRLVSENRITIDTAIEACNDPDELKTLLRNKNIAAA